MANTLPLLIGGVALLILLVFVVILVRYWRGQGVVEAPVARVSPTQLLQSGDAELDRLLAAGNKIGAIKRVRELTGVGLREAKEYVEKVAVGHTPLPSSAQTASAPSLSGIPADVEQEARRLLAAGNKLAAIKRVRELTGAGLKEAKEYVEGL